MGFFGTWLEGLRIGSDRRRVTSAEGLRDALSAQAAFVAQKVVTEYCQAKAGRNWHQLSSERTFVEDLARSRWEAFAIVLSDLFLMAEALIRPAAGGIDAAGQQRLVRLYADALAMQPRPVHRPQGWADREAEFAARLALAATVPPAPARAIAAVGGQGVFDVLPIHLNMRRLDGPMVANAIGFQLAAVAGRLRRRLDVSALAGLLRAPDGAGEPAWGGIASSS